MKISYNWLKEHLSFDLSPEETGELLTSTGLEVESIEKSESVKGGLSGLVIGEVLEKEKHPDADKLSVTKVNVGTEEILTIVCGAPNVAKGQKVIVALPGTTLFPLEGESFKIKKSKIRGVESNGMICAEDEIGLGKDHNGIIILPNECKPGTPASEYYNIQSDYIFEIGLTPNRIDAASHRGVARDLRAALAQRKKLQTELRKQDYDLTPGTSVVIPITIENNSLCKRYTSVLISNVKVAESPEWLKQKLSGIGLRPINNIVDITNYVLHDLGQPLHAFDADKIIGKKVVVRNAKAGGSFITLDEVERKMDGTELMICNAEKEMCIAGIFGGTESGVTEKTTTVFLESAWFDPACIRKTAKKFALNTDASFRFERGADITLTELALKKAAHLMVEIAGGKIASAIDDQYPEKAEPEIITINLNSVCRLIGNDISSGEIKSILSSLDFVVLKEENEMLTISIPSYRVDVTREPDVVEEILRIYGYNEIPLPEKMSSSLSYAHKPDPDKVIDQTSDFLSANGFFEIMTNSLTTSSQLTVANQGERKLEAVSLLNPLSSELDILRTGLLLNGLNALAYNINRQQYDLKFYEFGKIYSREGNKYQESYSLSLFVTGRKKQENWTASNDSVSFYSLTGILDTLFQKLGIAKKTEKKSGQHALLSDVLNYISGNNMIATVGKVSKNALKFADIKQPVFAAEIHWEKVMELYKKVKIQFEELPKFPSVRRDLSLLLDEKVKFDEIEKLARKVNPSLIKNVNLFDVYEGKNLESGKKSYAISISLYNDEATLTDNEVDKVMTEIIQSLEKNIGAQLR